MSGPTPVGDLQRLLKPVESQQVRLEGVRMAVAAMRKWRAAPARLTPMLTAVLAEKPSPVRAAALRALAASLTASRLASDELAALLDDPELGAVAATALGCIGDHRAVPFLVRMMSAGSDDARLTEAFRAVAEAGADSRAPVAAARQILAASPDSCAHGRAMRVLAAFGPDAAAAVPELLTIFEGADRDTATCVISALRRIGPAAAAAVPILRRHPTEGATLALLSITADRAVADQYLAELPEELRRALTAAALLTWLAVHGGLTARQHRQVRNLFRVRGFAGLEAAHALWLHEGPAAAPELLQVLPECLHDDLFGLRALRVLSAMGPHARPVLGRLDEFLASRSRVALHIGDDDAEMRADERLVAATMAVRAQVR